MTDMSDKVQEMAHTIANRLRIMADNIDATRPEHDYSAAHKRVDDDDISALRRAAWTIDDCVECFASLAKERDLLWEDLERVTKERDEARRMACEAFAAGDDEEASEYARLRNWDCFAHTEGASAPDNSREANQ